jgi:hypothetical protein
VKLHLSCFRFLYLIERKKAMAGKVELIPVSEGNRITVQEDEKVIIGRGSSLGVCSFFFFENPII